MASRRPNERSNGANREQLLAQLPNHLIDWVDRNLCVSYAERKGTLSETAGRMIKRT